MANTGICVENPQACSTIDAIYWWFLGHAADPTGQDYWIGQLLDLTVFAGDPKTAAAAIALNYATNAPRATSSTFHGNFVQNLGFGWNQDVAFRVVGLRYQKVLGGPPDLPGQQYWCSWLVNGWHSIDELDCQLWMARYHLTSCDAPASAPAPPAPSPAPAPAPPTPVAGGPAPPPAAPVPVQQPNLPPASAAQIESWYELYLCRPADLSNPNGAGYWLTQPDAGHTMAAIAASTEAQAVLARGGCNPTPAGATPAGGSSTPLIIAGVGVAAVLGIILVTKPAAPVRPNATRLTPAA